jgi:hypothetical protein
MKRFRVVGIFLLGLSALTGSSVGILAENLKNPNNRADYVIIAPSPYYAFAETLAVFRHEKNGFTTMVVNMDTVLTQFGSGVSPDTALKSFIQYALNNWDDPKPQYFVLAGDTKATPSHPEPEPIIIPGVNADSILMIDQWFVEVPDSNSNLRVNACIGRLPAWDSLGFSNMVTKTIEYEKGLDDTWCSRAIFLSDYDTVDGGFFESFSSHFKSILDSVWSDTVSVSIQEDSPLHLDSTGFVNLWNAGASVVTYFGQEKQTLLSKTHYFTTMSVDSLHNGVRLPVCFLGECDLKRDTCPPGSIPTHLLERKGGGAVAVISFEGLMYEYELSWFYSSMMSRMVEKPDQPIGISFKETVSDYVQIGRAHV